MSEVWDKKRKKVSLAPDLFGIGQKSRFRGRGPPTKKRRWGVRREPSRPAGAKILILGTPKTQENALPET